MSRRTNRELVMLAQVFEIAKHRLAGMYMSIKYDGMRCLWVPWTKGMAVKDVPFSNTEKDSRKHICSGLWSRYGKVIHCPEWFTEGFPKDRCLDGELYLGRKAFQTLMSVVKPLVPNDLEWRSVKYMIIDIPPPHMLFRDGKINNPQWTTTINKAKCEEAFRTDFPDQNPMMFESSVKLMSLLALPNHAMPAPQTLLPFSTPLAKEQLFKALEDETNLGGEGLILRHPASIWTPERSSQGFLMKVKPFLDSEADVVGYYSGLGKFEGMLGALKVRWYNPDKQEYVLFDLSGFTDEERKLLPEVAALARETPGVEIGREVDPSPTFPYRSKVTFRYRELSDSGIPKEARYLRKRVD